MSWPSDENRAAAVAEVVIPTWNGRVLLERCLETIRAQTVPARVIVVDNGSTDGTGEFLERTFPEVDLIALPKNHGFAAAVNRGIAAGHAPFVVLVNNDVECDPGFVDRIVAPMRAKPAVGMVAALLLKPGRREIDSFGLELDRTLAAFPRFAGAPYREASLHALNLAAPSGGAAAYRREAFTEVGGFDERLFAYMEDVDLGLRLRAAGWECEGAPGAVGVHLGSATIGRRSRTQVEVAGASRAYMLRRYGVLGRGIGTAAWALGMELGVTVLDTLIGRDLAPLRGRIRGWRRATGPKADVVPGAVNPEIGVREALRRRLEIVRAQAPSRDQAPD